MKGQKEFSILRTFGIVLPVERKALLSRKLQLKKTYICEKQVCAVVCVRAQPAGVGKDEGGDGGGSQQPCVFATLMMPPTAPFRIGAVWVKLRGALVVTNSASA